MVRAVEWAVPYVLLGAVVVVPLWLVTAAFRLLRRRENFRLLRRREKK